jgi:hypothetical protein
MGPFSHDSDLDELRHHWGEAYSIMRGRDGWQAKRRDGRGGWIIRESAEELLEAIRADYAKRPVPRDGNTFPPAGGDVA